MARFAMPVAARFAVVVVISLVCGAAAYAFSESQEERFRATTRLSFDLSLRPDLVLSSDFPSFDASEDGPAQTNAATVASRDIAVATASMLDLDPDDVEDDVRVTVDRGTAIVAISAAADTKEDAELLARTYRGQYKRLRAARERARARSARRTFQRRLREMGGRRATGSLASSVRDRIVALTALEREGTGFPEVIEAAHADDDPAEPDTRRNVLFGLLFGFVLGVGLTALLRDRSRPARDGAPRDDLDD